MAEINHKRKFEFIAPSPSPPTTQHTMIVPASPEEALRLMPVKTPGPFRFSDSKRQKPAPTCTEPRAAQIQDGESDSWDFRTINWFPCAAPKALHTTPSSKTTPTTPTTSTLVSQMLVPYLRPLPHKQQQQQQHRVPQKQTPTPQQPARSASAKRPQSRRTQKTQPQQPAKPHQQQQQQHQPRRQQKAAFDACASMPLPLGPPMAQPRQQKQYFDDSAVDEHSLLMSAVISLCQLRDA